MAAVAWWTVAWRWFRNSWLSKATVGALALAAWYWSQIKRAENRGAETEGLRRDRAALEHRHQRQEESREIEDRNRRLDRDDLRRRMREQSTPSDRERL